MPRPLPEENGYLEVVVQPLPSLRFRYKSEAGKSMISGDGNAPCMIVKVHNFTGTAKLYASVVTVPDVPEEKPQPHPHQLAGPHTGHGIYSKDVYITATDNTFKLDGLYLVSIPAKDALQSLQDREEKKVDPFGTGFKHKDKAKHIDRNYVQICFQLAVFIPGQLPQLLKPVLTNAILNTSKKGGLEIVKITPSSGPSRGERRMIILMNGISKKEDVKGLEFRDKEAKWTGQGIFKQKRIHEMSAISLLYPKYDGPAFRERARKVDVVLVTKRGESEPIAFHYLPESSLSTKKKDRKVDLNKTRPVTMDTDNSAIPFPVFDQKNSNSKSWSNVSNSLPSDDSNPPKSSTGASAVPPKSTVEPKQPAAATTGAQPEDSSSGPSSPLQSDNSMANEVAPQSFGSNPTVLANPSLTSSEGSLPSDVENRQRQLQDSVTQSSAAAAATPALTQPQPSPKYHRVEAIPSQPTTTATPPPAATTTAAYNKPVAPKRAAKAWVIVPAATTATFIQPSVRQQPAQARLSVPTVAPRVTRSTPQLQAASSSSQSHSSLKQTDTWSGVSLPLPVPLPKSTPQETPFGLNEADVEMIDHLPSYSSPSQDDMDVSVDFDPNQAAANLFSNMPPPPMEPLPNISSFSQQKLPSVSSQISNQVQGGPQLTNQRRASERLPNQIQTGQQLPNQIAASRLLNNQIQVHQHLSNQNKTGQKLANQVSSGQQLANQVQVGQQWTNEIPGRQQLPNQVSGGQKLTNQVAAEPQFNEQTTQYFRTQLTEEQVLVQLTPELQHQLRNPTQILANLDSFLAGSLQQGQPSAVPTAALVLQNDIQQTQHRSTPTNFSPGIRLVTSASLDSSNRGSETLNGPFARPRATVTKPRPAPRTRARGPGLQTEPERRRSAPAQAYQGDYREVQPFTPLTANSGGVSAQPIFQDAYNADLDDLQEIISQDLNELNFSPT